MANKLYIREHIDKKEEEYIKYDESPFIEKFYDPDKEILFKVIELPKNWEPLDPFKIYEFEFEFEFNYWETEDKRLYKVYQQIGTYTYIVAEYYRNMFYKQSFVLNSFNRYIPIITVEEYLKQKRGF